ncbi:nucleoside ABC transporter membrane protein [Hasllibacter halocynthiae]|uniref:Nucleoside ABC transporter membrane protein n=1 Tax=Hasllibacter halocynthiae TaxID=595589 RepID=A0A2T0X177_9RHOB|nr:ABC transporter permease [Hasllibacter halocynthiae]PRY92645.1 nucleoside ABC transporter membrane protein [Hasllibacter halocynthiae]
MPVIDLNWTAFLASVLVVSTPFLLAALGELVVERAGVLNLGVEGMMITGAAAGIVVAIETGSPWAGFLCAALGGLGLGLVFALLTQGLQSNQVATGLGLTLFGLGFSALLAQGYVGVPAPTIGGPDLGPLRDVPILGPALFARDWVVYLGLLAALGVWLYLFRTRSGLILRAVGEGHDAAHALGYRVRATRVAAIAFGGAMAGLAGGYLTLVRVPSWTDGMTAGAGWIALAIVVFGGWRPGRVLLGAWLFGGAQALQLRLQAAQVPVPVELLSMSPYLITIAVLVAISVRRRAGGAAPACLGQPFRAGA